MAVRRHDNAIWGEDWFLELTQDYKLFYLYAKDKAEQSGIWHPNVTQFRTLHLSGKILYKDQFLEAVNKHEKKIIVLSNGNWLFTEVFVIEIGRIFNPASGAHRGALKHLVDNGVHPSEIAKVEWGGLETLDIQSIIKMVHTKTMYRQTIDDILSMHGLKEKEKDQEQDQEIKNYKKGNGDFETPVAVQVVYDSEWEALIASGSSVHLGLTKEGFEIWKSFVDFLVTTPQLGAVFRVQKFISPKQFQTLYFQKGFSRDRWEDILVSILGSELRPTHDLYFRIQQFQRYPTGNKSIGNGGGEMSKKIDNTNPKGMPGATTLD